MTEMAEETLTLDDYLRRPNPVVNSAYSWTGTNTKSRTSTHTKPKEIVEWKDFNYNSLQAMYGDTLKLKIHLQNLPNLSRHLPFHLSEIQDEDSLEALLIRWNNTIVSYALSVAQRSDGLIGADTAGYREGEIFMARGGHAFIPGTKPSEKALHPDWAGIIPSNKHQEGTKENRKSHMNVLPGDSKLSTKWKSSRDPDSLEFKKPFFQIFHYCELADVRYGYLLTQEELVVVRISRKPRGQISDPTMPSQRPQRLGTSQLKKEQAKLHLPEKHRTKEHGVLEYKSIRWDDGSQREEASLSINLALWWLHMLAATARSIESSYRDLLEEYISETASKGFLGAAQNAPHKTKQGSIIKGRKRRRDYDTGSNDSTEHLVKEDNVGPSRKFARSFSNPMQID